MNGFIVRGVTQRVNYAGGLRLFALRVCKVARIVTSHNVPANIKTSSLRYAGQIGVLIYITRCNKYVGELNEHIYIHSL